MFRFFERWKKCSSTEVGSYVTQADFRAYQERMDKKMSDLQNQVNQETTLLQQLQDAAKNVGSVLATQSKAIADLKEQIDKGDVDPAIIDQISANNAELAGIVAGLVSAATPPADTTGDAGTTGTTGGVADATVNNQ